MFRVGNHTTSDDSSRYRSDDDVKFWNEKGHPITRSFKYLVNLGIWSESQDTDLRNEQEKRVKDTLRVSESQPKPAMEDMFQDVYDGMPLHIDQQFSEMRQHVANHSDHYPTNYRSDR